MKILLVDDDTGVLQAMLALLRRLPGHEVSAATSGMKALENADTMGGPDLLITDVVMEGMDGFLLRDTLLTQYPQTRVIFMTGYDLTDYVEQVGSSQVLQKPVDAGTLTAAVQREETRPRAEEPVDAATSPIPITKIDAPAGADDLTGKTVGPYQVVRKLGDGKWGAVYEALQTTMGRNVALKVLSSELEKDPEAKGRFIADASAKARVQHPYILSVYEAGENDGACYYTHELVEGSSMADLVRHGQTIDEPTALQLIRAAAEGLSYLNHQGVAHSAVEPASLYLGLDGRPRMANLATHDSAHPATKEEIRSLGEIALSVLPEELESKAFGMMLERMQDEGPGGFASWAALLQAVKALEPKVIPVDAFKLNAQEEAAIRAVEEAKKRQKRQIIGSVLGIIALFWALGAAVWWTFFKSNERVLDQQVTIPAGEFIYQDGQKITLPAFSVDRYEVTFGQYARFLADLERNPTTQYDHARQPKGKSHKPGDWDIYYGRARANKPVTAKEGGGYSPIDLNCPVFRVDFWDAYAYAKWKGRRLPTEQEWERAGRGKEGLLYPWGKEFDPKKCNAAPSGIGHWVNVDSVPQDRSPDGVVGMAGNVSEWTDSWDATKKFPVIRGGSYHTPDCKLTRRVTEADPETAHEFLGFRTVGDPAPPAK